MSEIKLEQPPYEVTVGLDRGEIVVFDPGLLNVFAEGRYRVTFRLAPALPGAVTFEPPYIVFKGEAATPFEVLDVAEDGQSFELGGLNRHEGPVPERYPYQVVLGLAGQVSHESPDPSIIHHGTDGGPGER